MKLEDIRGAVARGYCAKENETKVLDADLCEAISIEIKKLSDLENVPQAASPTKEGICELCGKPMPKGEEMFRFHGYSDNCPS